MSSRSRDCCRRFRILRNAVTKSRTAGADCGLRNKTSPFLHYVKDNLPGNSKDRVYVYFLFLRLLFTDSSKTPGPDNTKSYFTGSFLSNLHSTISRCATAFASFCFRFNKPTSRQRFQSARQEEMITLQGILNSICQSQNLYCLSRSSV